MFDKEFREFRKIAELGLESAKKQLEATNTTNKLLYAILKELEAERSKEKPNMP